MKNFFKTKPLDSTKLEAQLTKALRPLIEIVNNLRQANEDIDNQTEKNENNVKSMREKIDNLVVDNLKLEIAKNNNERTIEKIQNIFSNRG